MVGRKHERGTIEELGHSGKVFVRWDLKIGTERLKQAKGHLRRDLFLRQLKADTGSDILRGRQTMKLSIKINYIIICNANFLTSDHINAP